MLEDGSNENIRQRLGRKKEPLMETMNMLKDKQPGIQFQALQVMAVYLKEVPRDSETAHILVKNHASLYKFVKAFNFRNQPESESTKLLILHRLDQLT